jgi:hypothetical protein
MIKIRRGVVISFEKIDLRHSVPKSITQDDFSVSKNHLEDAFIGSLFSEEVEFVKH